MAAELNEDEAGRRRVNVGTRGPFVRPRCCGYTAHRDRMALISTVVGDMVGVALFEQCVRSNGAPEPR